MLISIWRYSRALIHYELEYLLYNCTHETIDNMADFTKIQSSSDLSYGLSLACTPKILRQDEKTIKKILLITIKTNKKTD